MVDITLPYTGFLSLAEPPAITGPLEFSACGVLQTLYGNEDTRTADVRIAHTASAHVHGPLPHQISLTKHKLQDKLLRIL